MNQTIKETICNSLGIQKRRGSKYDKIDYIPLTNMVFLANKQQTNS